MSTPKFRKAYQATLYRKIHGSKVDRFQIGTLFASSIEARIFAMQRPGWKSGRFDTVSIAMVPVSARKFEAIVSASPFRT